MNLVFAIKSLNVPGGGAERVLVEVANRLTQRGHTLTAVTFDGPGRSFYPLSDDVARVDLAVGPPGKATPKLRLLKALPRMRRAIRRIHPDLVVGFMYSMNVPLGFALLGSGIPIIASEHIGSAHFHRRPAQRLVVRLARSIFAAKTVPSEAVRNEYALNERARVFVLPNPLDLRPFAGLVSQPPSHPPKIVAVGRLMEQKNQIELIAAFALLAENYPEWRLRIVGDGELRGVLESQIETLRLTERIEMPGVVQDMASEYARAHIVAIPSRYESFGMVTAEAQASGRPVIAFADCAANKEMIRHGENGMLVSSDGDRVANLAAGLRTLMDDQALRYRLGAAGPASVEKFSVENVIDAWERFFLDCVAASTRFRSASDPGIP